MASELASGPDKVSVDLGPRSYDIRIAAGELSRLGSRLNELLPAKHAVLIADAALADPSIGFAESAAASVAEGGLRVTRIDVPSGETSKSPAELERIWEVMLDAGTDRKSVVVALGGGVIGDLAGFAAASYTRGVPFYQVPTTLLSQVDSSVGGKTGINLSRSKNMVGAFWQPIGVSIDPDTLRTLADREYGSGLAEVVKYGVILDAAFFDWLDSNADGLNGRDGNVLVRTIARCCRLKADVVEQDERETTGLRAVLNYGHTFAHAIEAVAGYGQLLHGEAVSIGMACAAELSVRLGRVDASFLSRQNRLLEALSLPIRVPPMDLDSLMEAMRRDKKTEHGKLRFVLPTRMGHVELVDGVAERLVADVWRACGVE
ncbi:MAG TPA: 3-dehydroquinate synthase [Pirellulaceae bacterium]|nr:3-dehydroquinate synthase [Pirellulaceae bacterium]